MGTYQHTIYITVKIDSSDANASEDAFLIDLRESESGQTQYWVIRELNDAHKLYVAPMPLDALQEYHAQVENSWRNAVEKLSKESLPENVV